VASPPSSSFRSPEPVNGLGIAGFVLSILGVLTCGMLTVLSLPLSLIALAKRPRGFAIAGTVISLVGVALFASIGWGAFKLYVLGRDKITELQGIAKTQVEMQVVQNDVERYRAENNNVLPDGIEGNKLAVVHKDGWGTALKYETIEGGYIIRSAGPDKQFDTADDVKSNEKKFADQLQIDAGGGPTDGPIILPSETLPTETPPSETPEASGTDSPTDDEIDVEAKTKTE
jgi:hypothetical protein